MTQGRRTTVTPAEHDAIIRAYTSGASLIRATARVADEYGDHLTRGVVRRVLLTAGIIRRPGRPTKGDERVVAAVLAAYRGGASLRAAGQAPVALGLWPVGYSREWRIVTEAGAMRPQGRQLGQRPGGQGGSR